MKKIAAVATIVVIACAIVAGFAADNQKLIVGVWKFDMGGGFSGVAEYKADGTFTQKIGKMTISGKYTVKGAALTTDAQGQKTVFTIVSITAKEMVQKRGDGKTMKFTR